jgi:peptidoglycan biosynthesis protein MviN/MurJ (putative lipid II flippase)
MAYGLLAGAALTVTMLAGAPWLLHLFTPHPDSATWNTLLILSLCYTPIFCIGIWSGICTAQGHNLWAMSMTGLPYLVMTLALLALYATHTLNNLGLPISMGVGFCLVGAYAFVRIVKLNPDSLRLGHLANTQKMPDFRAFLRELSASSIENLGYAGNQLLILLFLARAGTGAISANNCGMRIGMLGFSLLAQPLAQLVQAKLCGGNAHTRPVIFRQWFVLVASGVVLMALALFTLRMEVIRAVYMHGKFQSAELNQVAALLPAWIGYFIVLSLNAVVARYLFTEGKGTTYVRRQLSAYAAANILRFALAGSFGAPMIIWCSVLTESVGLLFNIRTCLSGATAEAAPALALPGEA